MNKKKIHKLYRKCVYCNSQENLTIDHVVPIYQRRIYGLQLREIHNYGNLVSACKDCNDEKSHKTLEEFFRDHKDYKRNFLSNAWYVSDRILEYLNL